MPQIHYLREVPDDYKPGTNILKSVGDCFIGQATVIDADAVRDDYDEFAGSSPEGILRCLHQAEIAVTFLEVEFFVAVNKRYGNNEKSATTENIRQLLSRKWFEPKSISSSYNVIVRVRVVLKRTVVAD